MSHVGLVSPPAGYKVQLIQYNLLGRYLEGGRSNLYFLSEVLTSSTG